MRYASLRSMDISNGEGIGVALFVQGCHAHCPNCFNPETWDFCGGKEWSEDTHKMLLSELEKPYISRFSVLGGEPLAEENLAEVTEIVKEVKTLFPDKKIWLWSGFDFESEIRSLPVTEYLDYVVDGLYIDSLKDMNLMWRGSSNQNIWQKENGTWQKIA